MLISNVLRFIFTCPLSLALPITFHCFRHTFATLQIAAGTDIYTVSKMLTHRNVSTTQIYAELVNEKKRESANRISLK
ncbi:MAG: tyrosine-type recombinase/integrase [Eubacteriales bacterium]|nr:tyrosine-type recombinase/integrase [Eubacteriales bacterium]